MDLDAHFKVGADTSILLIKQMRGTYIYWLAATRFGLWLDAIHAIKDGHRAIKDT